MDADLTSIASLSSTSAYLRRSAANTYVLDSYSTLTGNLTSAGVIAKTLTGGSFPNGVFNTSDTILQAFQLIDDADITRMLLVGDFDGTGGTTMPIGSIIVGGGSSGAPNNVSLTLSGTGGTFGLSGTGVLTMPDAATATRGLLTSTDWNTFNNKQAALVSGTNIKTINGTSVLGSGDIVVSGGGLTVGTTTITSGTTTRILYNNSGVVGEYTLTGTGTVVAMQTSPTFLTDVTTPKIIGGTGVTSKIQYLGTSGNGTSTAVAHEFLVGNNGATTAGQILNSGQVLIGTTTAPLGSQAVRMRLGSGTNTWDFGSWDANSCGLWCNAATPSTTNYRMYLDGTYTMLNSPTQTWLKAGGVDHIVMSGSDTRVANKLAVGSSFSPAANLHSKSTTEQLRAGYDDSNYFSATVGSTGTTTFNAVGSGAKFVFSDNIELTQTVTTEAVTSDRTVTVVINGTTYKLLAKA